MMKQLSIFFSYVNEQISCLGISGTNIVNIDETNIDFEMVSGMTLSGQGDRTVSIKKSGSSSRCTVLLGVTLSGDKLPPMIIFKGQPNGRIAREWNNPEFGYPEDCEYEVQEKAWIDQVTFLKWIQKVWVDFCTGKGPTYLLMDEFVVHKCSECVRYITSCGTDVEYIVGG